MQRVDIKIGYQCNNHCVFCVQGNKRERLTYKSFKEIKKSLKEAFQKGATEVVLTGGEPTLHPDFLEIVKLCKKIGYQVIQIQTNGRRFAYLDFCIKTVQAGATQFAPSLHGPNARIHDFLTDAPGSFKQTVQGIKNLRKLGQRLAVNSVITTKNYKYIPQTAKLLVKLDANQFQFSFVHILGSADKNKDWLIAKKSEIMPYIKRGLNIGVKAKKEVTTEAIPYCFMRGHEECVAEKNIPKTMIYDDLVTEDYEFFRKTKGKSKNAACATCMHYEICEGPWKEYVKLFGWDEFKPVKK